MAHREGEVGAAELVERVLPKTMDNDKSVMGFIRGQQ